MITIVWQSVVLAVAGVLLLRISGRKSISQMTIPQVGILLTLGTILGSQVAGKGMGSSIVSAAIFLGILYLIEWATLQWNKAEKIIKGGAVPVIENGKLLTHNMKKLRVTVDDLEKRLRMMGISRYEDVKVGTIENNGEMGYELMEHAKPVTMGDLERLLRAQFPHMDIPKATSSSANIFSEVVSDAEQKNAASRLQ